MRETRIAEPGRLRRGEIEIWCIDGEALRDDALARPWEASLNDLERARADRFAHADNRRQFVVGRGVLRHRLGNLLGIEPADVAFQLDRYGRLALAPPEQSRIGFNVTHTDGMVAVAIGSEPGIGIDAERFREDFPHLEVARHAFPAASTRALEELKESEREARFFEYWVLLEAYAKALGLGLSLPFDCLQFHIAPGDPPRIRLRDTKRGIIRDWSFWLFAPTADLRLAVAARQYRGLLIHNMRGESIDQVVFPLVASNAPSGSPT